MDPDVEFLVVMAEDPQTSPSELVELAESEELSVRLAVAGNRSTPPAMLRKLCLLPKDLAVLRQQVDTDNSSWFVGELPPYEFRNALRLAVASNRSITPDIIDGLLQLALGPGVETALRRNPTFKRRDDGSPKVDQRQVLIQVPRTVAARKPRAEIPRWSVNARVLASVHAHRFQSVVARLCALAGLESTGALESGGSFDYRLLVDSRAVIGGTFLLAYLGDVAPRPQVLSEIRMRGEALHVLRTIVVSDRPSSTESLAYAAERPLVLVTARDLEPAVDELAPHVVPEPGRERPVAEEAPDMAMPVVVVDDIIGALLASPIYARQALRAGRATPSTETAATLLSALLASGGKVHTNRLERLLPRHVVLSTVVALKRLLNVEGYPVLESDPRTSIVTLDVAMLRAQFDLG